MNFENLETLSNLTFEEIDKNNLIEIENISINQNLSAKERIKEFLENTENPYFLRCGNYIVKTSFSDNDIEINDCVYRYINQCLDERL